MEINPIVFYSGIAVAAILHVATGIYLASEEAHDILKRNGENYKFNTEDKVVIIYLLVFSSIGLIIGAILGCSLDYLEDKLFWRIRYIYQSLVYSQKKNKKL